MSSVARSISAKRPSLRPGDHLGSGGRAALGAWLITRLAVLAVSLIAAALWSSGESFPGRWSQWDADLLTDIARYGYGGDPGKPPDPGLPAFFPGFPLLLRAVHVIVPNWSLAGVTISLVAGGVAVVALARLAEREAPAGSGIRTVIALLFCPYAVFLFPGYTEALFLGLALPAWLLARERRWELAAICAAGAASVRITGLFLAIALIIEFLTRDRRWRRAPWLIVPFLPIVGYTLYQWARTGDPLAWQHAQKAGWGRALVPPWQALHTTWDAAFGVQNEFTGAFRAELAAAAIGLVLTGWLLLRRRWAEFGYVGLQMVALLCSAFYLSIGRATLLWWPLWLGLGALGTRRPVIYVAILAVCAPLLAVEIMRFTAGSWAG